MNFMAMTEQTERCLPSLVLDRKKCNRMGPRKCILNAAERRRPLRPCWASRADGNLDSLASSQLMGKVVGPREAKVVESRGVGNDRMAAATSPLCYTNGPVVMQHSPTPGASAA
jgi:hypothetical protein